jgi:hypothetical protein
MGTNKQDLIDKLEQCKSTVDNALFNTKIAQKKCKTDNKEDQIALNSAINSYGKTIKRINEIIQLLIENPAPPFPMLEAGVNELLRTVKWQEEQTRAITLKLFKEN